MEKRLLFGTGSEQNVYQDSHRPERLIKESKSVLHESIARIKARYYLTKIIHLLIPAHVPDIHRVSREEMKTIMSVEKKYLDKRHEFFRESEVRIRTGKGVDHKKIQVHHAAQEQEIRASGIREKFEELLEDPDMAAINFGIDQETGQTVYVDSFIPWRSTSNGISRGYRKKRLAELIEKLPDEKRDIAYRYLKRLEELFLTEYGYTQEKA